VFDLSPQDAIVYAAIRSRLELDHGTASCFVSTNEKDFKNVVNDLATLNCKYFPSFETALPYIEHIVRSK